MTASHSYLAPGFVNLSVPQSDCLPLASSTSRAFGRLHNHSSSARPGTLPHFRLGPAQELHHLATRPHAETEVYPPMQARLFIHKLEVWLEFAIFRSTSALVKEKSRNGQTREAAPHTYWQHSGGEM